jgi:hypothetical protein
MFIADICEVKAELENLQKKHQKKEAEGGEAACGTLGIVGAISQW